MLSGVEHLLNSHCGWVFVIPDSLRHFFFFTIFRKVSHKMFCICHCVITKVCSELFSRLTFCEGNAQDLCECFGQDNV